MINKGAMSARKFNPKKFRGSQIRREHVFLGRFRYWPWLYGKREHRNRHSGYNSKRLIITGWWSKLQRDWYLKSSRMDRMKMGRYTGVARLSTVIMRDKGYFNRCWGSEDFVEVIPRMWGEDK